MTTTSPTAARCDGCGQLHRKPNVQAFAQDRHLCQNCVRRGKHPYGMTAPGPVRMPARATSDLGEVRTVHIADGYDLLVAESFDPGDELLERRHRDEIHARTVEAYALTWGTDVPARTVDGRPCWVRYNERAFDRQCGFDGDPDWVDEDPPLVMLNHGEGMRYGSRRGGIGYPLGQVVNAEADDFGLWVRCLFDPSDEARTVVDLMGQGRLSAFSSYVIPEASEEVGTRDGLPIFEVTEGWLIECGPTHEPSDTRAVILTVGGYEVEDRSEDYAAEARGREIVAGWLNDPRVQAQAQHTEERRIRRAEAAARRAEGLARSARMYAAVGAEERAREVLGELVDACGDADLARDVLATAGIE